MQRDLETKPNRDKNHKFRNMSELRRREDIESKTCVNDAQTCVNDSRTCVFDSKTCVNDSRRLVFDSLMLVNDARWLVDEKLGLRRGFLLSIK